MSGLKYLLPLLSLTFSLHASAEATNPPPAAPEQPASASQAQFKTIEQARVDALVDSIHQDIAKKKFDRTKLLVIAAKQGNAKACNLLGWMFDNGVAVKKDPKRALIWFESCSRSNPLASYNAAVLHIDGRGGVQNVGKGVKLLESAWMRSTPSFRNHMKQIPIRLAYYYRKLGDHENAYKWAERAAVMDAKHGKYLVARMLIEKTAPVDDPNRAFSYLNDAVNAYSAPAANLLAWSYGVGKFSKKDYVLAHQYEAIAAKINPRVVSDGAFRWTFNLSKDKKAKAEAMANDWISNHRKPEPLDFRTTLSGIEKQFK